MSSSACCGDWSGGKTIIFISHKLREVMRSLTASPSCGAAQVVGHLVTRRPSEQEIARMMVGRDVLLRVDKAEAKRAPSRSR